MTKLACSISHMNNDNAYRQLQYAFVTLVNSDVVRGLVIILYYNKQCIKMLHTCIGSLTNVTYCIASVMIIALFVYRRLHRRDSQSMVHGL